MPSCTFKAAVQGRNGRKLSGPSRRDFVRVYAESLSDLKQKFGKLSAFIPTSIII